MRSLIALLLIGGTMVGGCNRQSDPAPQANGTRADTAVNAVAANETLVEEIGTLDRDFAGQPAPTTAFENPSGARVTLADFRGKPLLLNLWATWCTPCVAEMPTLDALAESLGDKVQVMVLSQDFEGAAKVDPFFQKAAFKRLQPYLDKEAGFSLGMGLNLPTTILYDSQGKEVWRMFGGMDWMGQTARELIAEAR